MAGPPASDEAARESLRPTASGLALLAIAGGIVGSALVGIDLSTRPPCQPGYVRLIDLEPAVAIFGLVLAGVAGVVFWRSLRGTHLKTMIAISVVVLAFIALVDLGAVSALFHHRGVRYDDGCWTF